MDLPVSLKILDGQTSRNSKLFMCEVLRSVTAGEVTYDMTLRSARVVGALRRWLEIDHLERMQKVWGLVEPQTGENKFELGMSAKDICSLRSPILRRRAA